MNWIARRKLRRWATCLPPVTILFFTVLALLMTRWQPLKPPTNIDLALALYAESAAVQPSTTLAGDLDRIIRDRLRCYTLRHNPLDRMGECNYMYVQDILESSRKEIASPAETGLFIRAVTPCPIVFSMCMGDQDNIEKCIRMERQCIDAKLDRFWRGATSPQSY